MLLPHGLPVVTPIILGSEIRVSLSLSLSLHFNSHFPGDPGSRCLLNQRMMEVVVTTGLLEL